MAHENLNVYQVKGRMKSPTDVTGSGFETWCIRSLTNCATDTNTHRIKGRARERSAVPWRIRIPMLSFYNTPHYYRDIALSIAREIIYIRQPSINHPQIKVIYLTLYTLCQYPFSSDDAYIYYMGMDRHGLELTPSARKGRVRDSNKLDSY